MFLLLERLKDVLSKSGEIHESVSPPLVGGVVEQMLKTNKYKSREVWPGRGREEKDALNSNPSD